MEINATIVVQAFNFFIVYWMLRRFLFRPVVTIIEHEQAHENAMLDIIDQQQKSLEIQEKERQRHWYICQEYFTLHQPQLPTQSLLDENDEVHPVEIAPASPDEIAHIIADTRGIIEEKIKHVH
jgi:hypothetical protein